MATGQFHHAASPEAFLMPGDMSYYDGTSSESSAGSPLNTNVCFTDIELMSEADKIADLRSCIWRKHIYDLPHISFAIPTKWSTDGLNSGGVGH